MNAEKPQAEGDGDTAQHTGYAGQCRTGLAVLTDKLGEHDGVQAAASAYPSCRTQRSPCPSAVHMPKEK